jgi:hypothetical protein
MNKPLVRKTKEGKFVAYFKDNKNEEFIFEADSLVLAIKGWYEKFGQSLGLFLKLDGG